MTGDQTAGRRRWRRAVGPPAAPPAGPEPGWQEPGWQEPAEEPAARPDDEDERLRAERPPHHDRGG